MEIIHIVNIWSNVDNQVMESERDNKFYATRTHQFVSHREEQILSSGLCPLATNDQTPATELSCLADHRSLETSFGFMLVLNMTVQSYPQAASLQTCSSGPGESGLCGEL